MCGIFGFFTNDNDINKKQISTIVDGLFLLSESRGKESSGLSINNGKEIFTYKTPIPASKLVKSKKYSLIKNNYFGLNELNIFSILGHCRLVTNGYEQFYKNNQPVIKNEIVAVHNGIIVNSLKLWDNLINEERETELDSELIPTLVSKYINEGFNIQKAIKKMFNDIYGMTTCGLFFTQYKNAVLATNNGSLYYIFSNSNKSFIFASEKYIIRELISTHKINDYNINNIGHVEPNAAVIIKLNDLSFKSFTFNDIEINIDFNKLDKRLNLIEDHEVDKKNIFLNTSLAHQKVQVPALFIDHNNKCVQSINKLKRCTNCLLPETYPYIEYNVKGECNYCKNYNPIDFKGREQFDEILSKIISKGGKPDCLVPFSGGRDSSYTLHYIKKELGMNPIAFSYDWGMLTDLARRNQSRICGKLGVEHILISADIRKKRNNIKKNVLAWLNRPSLGTIPLFMAGDKQYFYYSNLLMKQNDLKLSILGENLLEPANFKSAFCGIRPKFRNDRAMDISKLDKMQMLLFYGKEFILNPSYLNNSIWDTLDAFRSYYLTKHKIINIFSFLKWDEEKIMNTLINEYDWETDPGTKTTWRIGDGTAAFYNYIYYTMAGFTENDTFRSNQIRENMMNRQEALELVKEENRPRWDSIKWYCDTIGIDFKSTIERINSAKKLY